jgi:hypothetical protein
VPGRWTSQAAHNFYYVRSSNLPTGSVVVPVHNAGEHFHRCLNSLSQAAPPPDEIIEVASGGEFCDPGDPAPGHWRTRTRAITARAATGDMLLFIDGDVAVSADIVNKITATFTGEAHLTAVIESYDDEPAEANFPLHHYVHQNGCDEASPFGALAWRDRQFMRAVGARAAKWQAR